MEESTGCVVGLVCLVIYLLVVICDCGSEIERIHNEAIKHGLAQYSPTTAKFEWREGHLCNCANCSCIQEEPDNANASK